MSYNIGNPVNNDDLKSKFRDFKINLLQNNYEFQIDTHAFEDFKKSNAYEVWTKHYPNEVLTGSISLLLHGISLRRNYNDLDIIVDDRSKITDYTPMKESNVENYIGTKRISIPINYKFFRRFFGSPELPSVKVDFFENKDCQYTTFEGLKIHNPIEIIHYKLYLSQFTDPLGYSSDNKHAIDLKNIFNLDLQ